MLPGTVDEHERAAVPIPADRPGPGAGTTLPFVPFQKEVLPRKRLGRATTEQQRIGRPRPFPVYSRYHHHQHHRRLRAVRERPADTLYRERPLPVVSQERSPASTAPPGTAANSPPAGQPPTMLPCRYAAMRRPSHILRTIGPAVGTGLPLRASTSRRRTRAVTALGSGHRRYRPTAARSSSMWASSMGRFLSISNICIDSLLRFC